MRLIDADELKATIECQKCMSCNSHNGARCSMCETADDIDSIDNSPTIDAEPVRHATRIPSKKHLWILDEDGEIDVSAMNYGYCNGPVCRVCGRSFCVHCNERDLKFHPDRKAVSAFDEETCDEHLICSECGRIIGPNEPYCHCGAKMAGNGERKTEK